MAPVVNIAVCGDFSQLQLVPHLNRLIDLGRVYYAARVSTNARALGLADDQACNAFLKEYLVQFHARYLHHLKASLFFPLYDGLWRGAGWGGGGAGRVGCAAGLRTRVCGAP